MTPEQQRIAIAETCGWTRIEGRKGLPPGKTSHAPSLALSDSDDGWVFIPNYPSDLNAMHEAEKLIHKHEVYDMRERYLRQLAELLINSIASDLETYEGSPHFENIFLVAHATAPQRAEAFLRTLNLWTP